MKHVSHQNFSREQRILEQIIENFPEFMEDTHLQIQYAKVPNKVDEKKSSLGKLEYKSGE